MISAAGEGLTFELLGQTLTVAPKDEHCVGGFWICTTHGETFVHNFAKDTHCSDGEHVLAWGCVEHGPEVP